MSNALFPEVRVNGEVIKAAEIALEAQNHRAPQTKPGWAWNNAARALVVRKLLLDKVAEAEIDSEQMTLNEGQKESREDAQIRALLELKLEVNPPNDAEIEAFWHANKRRFHSDPLWQASHILIAVDKGDEAAAWTRVQALSNQLKTTPTSFAAIARDVSDCPSRENGGKLEQLRPGDTVPEFEAILKSLSLDEISPPFRTRFGFHIVRLEAVELGQQLPLDAVRDEISEQIEKRNWTISARKFIEALVQEADIEGVVMTPNYVNSAMVEEG